MIYLQRIRSVVCAIKSRMGLTRVLFGGCFGVICGFIQGTWVGFGGWLSQRCDKNAQCSGRSSKSDAKVQKKIDVCKFRRLKNIEKYIKVVNLLAYVRFFVYLCSRKGYETRTTMQTDVKHQPNDAPITTDAIGTGNVQNKRTQKHVSN